MKTFNILYITSTFISDCFRTEGSGQTTEERTQTTKGEQQTAVRESSRRQREDTKQQRESSKRQRESSRRQREGSRRRWEERQDCGQRCAISGYLATSTPCRTSSTVHDAWNPRQLFLQSVKFPVTEDSLSSRSKNDKIHRSCRSWCRGVRAIDVGGTGRRKKSLLEEYAVCVRKRRWTKRHFPDEVARLLVAARDKYTWIIVEARDAKIDNISFHIRLRPLPGQRLLAG